MQTLYLDLIQLSLRLLPFRLLPLGDLLQHIVVVLVFAYYLIHHKQVGDPHSFC